jgi:hypothetical protein
VSWEFEHEVELSLVANLGHAQLGQVARPKGRLIFTQGAMTDELTQTMQLDSWGGCLVFESVEI